MNILSRRKKSALWPSENGRWDKTAITTTPFVVCTMKSNETKITLKRDTTATTFAINKRGIDRMEIEKQNKTGYKENKTKQNKTKKKTITIILFKEPIPLLPNTKQSTLYFCATAQIAFPGCFPTPTTPCTFSTPIS